MTIGRALILILALLLCGGALHAAGPAAATEAAAFPRPLESYAEVDSPNLWQTLKARVAAEPFNLVATVIFILAICHTFLAARFMHMAHDFDDRFKELNAPYADGTEPDRKTDRKLDGLRFKSTLFHFLGEVEAVFGIWAVVLAGAIVGFHGWGTMVHYLDGVNYTEPIFVFVIMAIAASKPVLRFAEKALSLAAALGKSSTAAWTLSILTIGPILGSFITEPAAMTICASLLLQRLYRLKPSVKLAYATLGLLFVNISVGGTLTHFAAPPVVMVAGKWGWDMPHMFMHFGWKAVVGICIANSIYYAIFRKELAAMQAPAAVAGEDNRPIPLVITIAHLLAIGWTVLNAHHPALCLAGLLFFMAFMKATDRHQDDLNLRSPLLVGFFLAALVVHGGLQQWWIAPVLGGLGEWPLMIGATALTAVNDNAAITYLASLVPAFADNEALKMAVVAGAVTGGGLTVIANAPNPAGQSILSEAFEDGAISPLGLFLAAIGPTIIMGAAFMLLPG
jgi:hypothetical protein